MCLCVLFYIICLVVVFFHNAKLVFLFGFFPHYDDTDNHIHYLFINHFIYLLYFIIILKLLIINHLIYLCITSKYIFFLSYFCAYT